MLKKIPPRGIPFHDICVYFSSLTNAMHGSIGCECGYILQTVVNQPPPKHNTDYSKVITNCSFSLLLLCIRGDVFDDTRLGIHSCFLDLS